MAFSITSLHLSIKQVAQVIVARLTTVAIAIRIISNSALDSHGFSLCLTIRCLNCYWDRRLLWRVNRVGAGLRVKDCWWSLVPLLCSLVRLNTICSIIINNFIRLRFLRRYYTLLLSLLLVCRGLRS